MIGLDTNILLRYLMQDDVAQAARAKDLIEQQLSEEEPGFVSVVVMAETAWVLERSYGQTSMDIAAAIERFLQIDAITVEHAQEVFIAVTALRQGRGTFADALIGELGRRAGCTSTMTFDRKALRLPHFAAL
ncbi:MAG TPA: type II toxin-antitoxin system VapC family toxin [Acetobacteraceae bacterium]